jgi:hypothetical protein
MVLALALPLLGGAIFPWNAAGAPFLTLPVIGAIGLAFIAAGLSLETYPGMALWAALVLPFALFLYIQLVGIVVPQVHGLVYVMAAAGFALLAIAVRPRLPGRLGVTAQRERTA